jgi:hypothetical protein
MALYNDFSAARQDVAPTIWGELDRGSYWEAGDYSVQLTVSTTHPNKKYSFNYMFSVTKSDADLVRQNAIIAMMAVCEVPDLLFNFAYSQLKRGP